MQLGACSQEPILVSILYVIVADYEVEPDNVKLSFALEFSRVDSISLACGGVSIEIGPGLTWKELNCVVWCTCPERKFIVGSVCWASKVFLVQARPSARR